MTDPTARPRVLAAWWARLTQEGALRELFNAPPATFTEFTARLEGKPVYAYCAETDDGTLTLGPVLWGIPWARGLKLGLWVPPEQRRKKGMLGRIEALLALAFEEYPVLIAVAQDAPHQRLYERYGFTGMTFPRLGDHGDLWLGWLTPTTWERRVGGHHG